MAELKAETGLSDYVDETLHSFGTSTKDNTIKGKFAWKQDIDTIQYLEPSCPSCTKVWYEDGLINYELTLSKVQQYQKGQTTVTKDIYIWINDGLDRFISNERKEKILNPQKKYVKYRITGLVIV